jgi:hypothetical protein|tara:strand:- start:2061 stop:2171 length:111 start_codon:yes stop_codon:yes gene_type:complete
MGITAQEGHLGTDEKTFGLGPTLKGLPLLQNIQPRQ